MLCCSWQKTLTTFWPFMVSWAKPSMAPTAFCWLIKYLAELPPMVLVTKNMAATPTRSTRVIHRLYHSMMKNTASTTDTERTREGREPDTSWRRVSMSLV